MTRGRSGWLGFPVRDFHSLPPLGLPALPPITSFTKSPGSDRHAQLPQTWHFPETWGGVRLATNDGGWGRIEHAEISHASKAVSVECCWGVEQPALISNVWFHHNRIALDEYAGNDMEIEGSVFEDNEYAITRADKIIRDSEFRRNQYGLYETERISVSSSLFESNFVALYGGRGAVEGCQITGNTIGIRSFFEGFTVTGNDLTGNDIGIILSSYNGSVGPVELNNFSGSTTFNLKNMTSLDLSMPNNWWGSTDPATIADSIWDGLDNDTLGVVDVDPILTEPRP